MAGEKITLPSHGRHILGSLISMSNNNDLMLLPWALVSDQVSWKQSPKAGIQINIIYWAVLSGETCKAVKRGESSEQGLVSGHVLWQRVSLPQDGELA